MYTLGDSNIPVPGTDAAPPAVVQGQSHLFSNKLVVIGLLVGAYLLFFRKKKYRGRIKNKRPGYPYPFGKKGAGQLQPLGSEIRKTERRWFHLEKRQPTGYKQGKKWKRAPRMLAQQKYRKRVRSAASKRYRERKKKAERRRSR